MDVLSDVLSTMRLKGSLYFSTEFRPPWGLRVPEFGDVARFHLMVKGGTWIEVAGGEPIHLEQGDLVLVPHGAEHRLTDDPATECMAVDDVVRVAGFTGDGALVFDGGSEGATTEMVCGHLQFAETIRHPLVEGLPDAIVVRREEYDQHAPLLELYGFIRREVKRGGPGMDAVVQRLAEVMFIEAVRFWASSQDYRSGFFSALVDANVSRSLLAIHRQPDRSWTLADLAREALLGRTAFTERFKKLVGMSPARYLTFWRIQKAKEMLRDDGLSTETVAENVGYESVASFSRVFKKVAGTTPGRFKRQLA